MPKPPAPPNLQRCLRIATSAARKAGVLMSRELRSPKKVAEATQHDIKLELDSQCQRIIERALQAGLPGAAILGEEGILGDPSSPLRWVVDPIDGTVNFTYGIPHACVSIALQQRIGTFEGPAGATYEDGYATLVGVVLDPFSRELWAATADGPALLNGLPIQASPRSRLAEAIIALGFAKHRRSLNRMLPVFDHLVHRVRKIRIMGAAALSMTYVASARFDGYIESGVRLWDIAAGGLIIQRAGGVFWRRETDGDRTYEIAVSGLPMQGAIQRIIKRFAA